MRICNTCLAHVKSEAKFDVTGPMKHSPDLCEILLNIKVTVK